MAGKPGRSGPPGNLHAFKHGMTALDRRLKAERLDRRSFVYKWVKSCADEYIEALGGDPSPQERTIIWDTAMNEFYESQLDGHLSRKKLVRKGKVDPTLAERTRLATHIRENLKTVGLKRVKRETTLDDMVANLEAQESAVQTAQTGPETANGSERRVTEPEHETS